MIRAIKGFWCVVLALTVCLAAGCDPDGGGGGANIDPKDVPYFKYIMVTSPTDGDIWRLDGTYDIRWTANAVEGKVRIFLLEGGAVLTELTSSNGTKNDGVYSWTIPRELKEGDHYQIQVSSADDPSIHGTSAEFWLRKIIYSFPTTD